MRRMKDKMMEERVGNVLHEVDEGQNKRRISLKCPS